MSEKYYLTTPIYYINSRPHIGHSYTQIAADTLARFKGMELGKENVFFLTGTDEHGQKVEKAAQAAGMPTKEFTDKMSLTFRELWGKLNIEFNDFIRTTEDRHIQTVQAVWRKLAENGDVYKHMYDGFYCVPCESFFTEGQLVIQEGKNLCPDCKRPVERMLEENYFFKISKYRDWLLQHIRDHKDFILPETRRNEVLGFLENNTLQDLCISRPKNRLTWGIQSPISADHVTYVWFDALINYISACGWPEDKKKFAKWWPADAQIIGKDILRHHAIYWPIMLKAIGVEPPKMIFAHGWWVQGGQKMSKSLGNVVDPIAITAQYGVDPYRYFLLREAPFGFDGTFSEEGLIDRFNHDLANDLGNLLHRSLTMCEKYFEGNIPAWTSSKCQGELRRGVDELSPKLTALINRLAFSEALMEIWALINKANKHIEERAPWKLSKEQKTDELKIVIVELLEVLRAVAQAVWPFMPATGEAIWQQLGIQEPISKTPFKAGMWGFFEKGGKVAKGVPLFPRIEVDKDKK